MKKSGAIVAACVAAFGCSTTLRVTRVDPHATVAEGARVDGIRYSLPIPFLLVCPGPKGTVSVTEEYLPDSDHQYAISAKSTLAKHDVHIDIENGLLKGIEWNPDATAVGGKAIDLAGTLGKTVIEERAKAAKAQADAADAAQSKRDSALASAEQAVLDARVALEMARAVLATVTAAGKKDTTNEQVDVVRAEKKYQAALEARDRLAGRQMEARGVLGQHGGAAMKLRAEGCVLLRVVDPPENGATLVQPLAQERYDTSVRSKVR